MKAIDIIPSGQRERIDAAYTKYRDTVRPLEEKEKELNDRQNELQKTIKSSAARFSDLREKEPSIIVTREYCSDKPIKAYCTSLDISHFDYGNEEDLSIYADIRRYKPSGEIDWGRRLNTKHITSINGNPCIDGFRPDAVEEAWKFVHDIKAQIGELSKQASEIHSRINAVKKEFRATLDEISKELLVQKGRRYIIETDEMAANVTALCTEAELYLDYSDSVDVTLHFYHYQKNGLLANNMLENKYIRSFSPAEDNKPKKAA